MRWSSKLYIGTRAAKKSGQIQMEIEGEGCSGKWEIITLSPQEHELLVIRPAQQLKKDWVRQACPLIVGLAANHAEAVELVRQMVEDCLRDTGALALKEYFSC